MSTALNTIESGPQTGPLYVFAHGAGAPMDSAFMNDVTKRLNDLGIRVRRFEFPYMAARRVTGKKRPPDRAPHLLKHFAQIIGDAHSPIVIGGKSMGGRIATQLAATGQEKIAGVVVFGFPFHAPGKPIGNRLDHFKSLQTPTLILQGTRDPFGKLAEATDTLQPHIPSSVTLHWIAEGNHDLVPPKRGGHTAEQNLHEATEVAAQFIIRLFN